MSAPADQARQRSAARTRFLAACSLAGAATTAYRNPGAGPTAEASWVDIARLGSPDAPNVLVLSCGLNGVEGYCGATILTEWLSRGRQRDVPRDVGLVMLHAVLPVAAAAGSAAAPNNTRRRNWSDNVLSAAARRFATYAERTGLKLAGEAARSEQGADDIGWLTQASDAVAGEVVEHARHVGLIEFHTSLRPRGDIAVASCHPPASAADQRVKSWFGEAVDAPTNAPADLDIFALGFADRMTDLTLTAAHVEFGVYATRAILQLDARRAAADRHAEMRALFAPDSEDWRNHVSTEGARIIGLALRGLSSA